MEEAIANNPELYGVRRSVSKHSALVYDPATDTTAPQVRSRIVPRRVVSGS
jgi:hypothetical protein